MSIHLRFAAVLRRSALFGLLGAGLLASAPAAQAQWFRLGFGLQPDQVERQVAASGYQLLGPVQRNGSVYIADVISGGGARERLLIDASSGHLLQRFRVRPALADTSRYFNADEDPPPRPPGLVKGRADADSAAPARRPAHDEIARTDDSTVSTLPLSPAAPVDALEKPKHKPAVVKRHKPDTAAPVEAAAPDKVAPTPAIVVAPAPAVVAPPEPRIAETKSVAPALDPAPAKPKPKKPALNDLPVDPLE